MLTVNVIRSHVRTVARKNGARLAVLFGSYARGTSTPRSDVDLLLVEATDQPFLDRLSRYLDPLVERLGVGVELLVYTPAEFASLRDNRFVRRALREGKVLYESGKTSG